MFGLWVSGGVGEVAKAAGRSGSRWNSSKEAHRWQGYERNYGCGGTCNWWMGMVFGLCKTWTCSWSWMLLCTWPQLCVCYTCVYSDRTFELSDLQRETFYVAFIFCEVWRLEWNVVCLWVYLHAAQSRLWLGRVCNSAKGSRAMLHNPDFDWVNFVIVARGLEQCCCTLSPVSVSLVI